MTQRICLALDLIDDATLIADYERWHQPGQAPVEIAQSIVSAGIEYMEIYRAGDRMFMIIDASDDFDEAKKAEADAKNPAVQKWIALMKKYQKPIPAAGENGTWFPMERIYRLTEHLD